MKKITLLFAIISLFALMFVLAGCATGEAKKIAKCSDSDGGLNYYVRGYVKSENFNPSYDVCQSNTTLREYVCRAYGWKSGSSSCSRRDGCIDYVSYKCAYGCKDGACVNATPTITCTDSDGGKNYYVRGYVILSNALSQAWDSCSYDADKGTWYLYETYCENNQLKTETMPCPYGCKKEEQIIGGSYYGACLAQNSTSTNQTASNQTK